MKIKFLLFILVLLTNLYSQINSDTLQTPAVISDSLKRDSTAADTTALLSDSLKLIRKDTLAAIHQSPFYTGSFFISNREMMFTDYRYTADFLELFPFTFVLDKGFVGQPNEVLLYGTGFNSINYFQDGILINDRNSNSIDLNNVQSESIDSIEIIPAPRGFLYGPVNNLVSVNLLTKDFMPKVPYSRIKYYEGPSGEAMFDGIFSAMLSKRLDFSADITNRNTEESEGFQNSGFSIWQAGAKLKYFLSNKINLIGSYYFVHSETGVNGGVDVDSIRRITSNVDSLLYNENLAIVVQPNALQKIKQHHFGLRMLWNPEENLKTDLNLYYKFYLDEITNIGSFSTDIKNKILGAALKENYNIGIFSSQINFNYEYQDFLYGDKLKYDPVNIMTKSRAYYNVLSVSPILSLTVLDSSLVVSLFYKYSSTDKVNSYAAAVSNGAGTDIFYKCSNEIKSYLGYSRVEFASDIEDFETIEAGATYSGNNLLFDLKFYNRKLLGSEIKAIGHPNSSGIGIKAEYLFWKLKLEALMNIPDENTFYNQFYLRGGIFYNDILFDSSLVLKTGFALYNFSRQQLVTQPPNETGISRPRIDFTLAGEIQKSAIAYFAWENLLDEDYFIVPYYPMPARSIRFGIAWEIFN
ncbi:MAG TPA: TonB-dependent receptor plug domain-containing protein [Ignavibacteriaceae bacterium]|nr:TonB-dependent receptor plug domain-containing protein [Ignavibacteriaceae bacterium]